MLAFVAAEAREFDGFLANAERVVKLNWPLNFARIVWLNGRAAVYGFLAKAERIVKLPWPLSFARIVWLNGRAGLLLANGPGPKLAGQALDAARERKNLQRLHVNLELKGLASTGFCGALDPALQPCDIFVATQLLIPPNSSTVPVPSRDRKEAVATSVHECSPITTTRKYKSGKLLSIDRVASTAAEKAELRQTGADAVEMEAAAVATKAQEWNLPFYGNFSGTAETE